MKISTQGYLLLAGGAEFGGRMAEVDRHALDLAGGPHVRVSIIPTAAAPDNNHVRAGENGRRWFSGLPAQQVEVVPLIDRASANDAAVVDALSDSRLIYLLGGFPGYLAETLAGSAAWEAMISAYRAGAVLGGGSAGAMVLCEYFFDPSRGQVSPGLGLIPGTCVLPHHDTFGKTWAARLAAQLPGVTLVGLDERTGTLDDGPEHSWNVYGQGEVTLYTAGRPTRYRAGDLVLLNKRTE